MYRNRVSFSLVKVPELGRNFPFREKRVFPATSGESNGKKGDALSSRSKIRRLMDVAIFNARRLHAWLQSRNWTDYIFVFLACKTNIGGETHA